MVIAALLFRYAVLEARINIAVAGACSIEDVINGILCLFHMYLLCEVDQNRRCIVIGTAKQNMTTMLARGK